MIDNALSVSLLFLVQIRVADLHLRGVIINLLNIDLCALWRQRRRGAAAGEEHRSGGDCFHHHYHLPHVLVHIQTMVLLLGS